MKTCSCWFCIMLVLFFVPTAQADEDWIGLESQSSWLAGVRMTQDESEDQTYSVYLSLTTRSNIMLDLQASDSTLVDEDERFDSDSFYGQLNLPLDINSQLGFSYQFQGQQQELEIEQFGIQLGFDPYPFFGSLEYSDGDLYIYTRSEIPTILNVPDSVRSSMRSQSIQLGWWFDSFSLSLFYQDFNYEENISALADRPLLQLLVKPAALAQTGLLVSNQASLSLALPLPQRALSLHHFLTRSAIDNSETLSLQLDWLETLGRHSSLFLSLSHSDEADNNWSIAVGLEWNS